MEALEQFGVFEGIKTDGTGQLVLQFLEGFLGYGLRFSHFITTTTTTKEQNKHKIKNR
jgi:hypothetical protein